MAIKQNFPDIKPSLNLDFANTKSLDPRIDFTRASTATYFDGETFAKAEENLITDSTFATEWVTSGANKTPGEVAPDGSASAIKLTEDTSSGSHSILDRFDYSGNSFQATFSVYLKSAGRDWVAVVNGGSSTAAWFNLSTGVIGTERNVDAAIQDLGNGWYRCSITNVDFSNPWYPGIHLSDADDNIFYTGDGTSGVYIWGPQLESGDRLTAYTETTGQPITNYIPVLKTAAPNAPRFDHDPVTGESKGLLIEEQRTNLHRYSQDFTQEWGFRQGSAIHNATIAPDGTQSAVKYVEDTTNDRHFIQGEFDGWFIEQGKSYCISVFAKAAERGFVQINRSGGDSLANFNVRDGVVNSVTTTDASFTVLSADAVPVGNGWYRCYVAFDWDDTSIDSTLRLYFSDDDDFGVNSSPSYQGDGFSGIYIWGAQVEEGSFPTSYIPTSGSQVTRVADSASITGENFSEWYRQDEGSFFVEMEGISDNYNSSNGTYSLLKVGPDPDSVARFIGFSQLYTLGARNSQSADVVSLASSTGNTEGKGALSYTFGPSGTLSGSVNGNLTVSENISANYGDGQISQQLKFGADLDRFGGNAPSSSGNVRWKKITYYPKRLPNAVLQTLTEE